MRQEKRDIGGEIINEEGSRNDDSKCEDTWFPCRHNVRIL